MDRYDGGASTRNPRSSPAPDASADPQLPLWCSVLAVAGCFVALAAWSWGKWTDAHIDFGAELYIPWRITEGDVLYRDIAYRHGPLSHHLNAAFFELFGVSLRTLVWCNLAILATLCLLIGRIFAEAFDRSVATGVTCAFLAVFGFSQYAGISNFNYVTPYLHAQTHGLWLAVATLTLLLAARRRCGGICVALAGFCFGGVLLTKAELAVPAAAAALFGLLLIRPRRDPAETNRAGGSELRAAFRRFAVFSGAALVPAIAFYAAFRSRMPADLALTGVLGNWHALGSGVLDDPYYRRGAGLDDVAGNLRRIFVGFAGMAGAAAVAAGADWAIRRSRQRTFIAALAGGAVFALAISRPALLPVGEWVRALPVTTMAIGGTALGLCLRYRADETRLRRLAPLALWSIFALGLLGKLGLNARFAHYGFVLAMPATLLWIACAVAWIPEALRDRFGGGALFRALALATVAAMIVFQLRESNRHYEIKNFAFGSGADAMWVEDPRIQTRGRDLAAAMAGLRAIMPPEASLLVLPDGVGLNYWLRRRDPSRFTLFLPPEFRDLGGEAAIVADLARDPADFIALVHRNHEEFGVGPFGRDPRNGRAIMQWVEANYRRVERFGEEPFQGRGFGVVVLRRIESAASEAPPESRETLR